MTDAHEHTSIAAVEQGESPASGAPGFVGMGPLSPAEVSFMPPLLRSLSTLLRLRGKPVSAEFLLAGLAGMGKVTPGACLRAAERTGLTGRILYREKMDNIPSLTLPCILLLTNDRSCVLKEIQDDTATVVFPEHGEVAQSVPIEKLAEEYSGYALFATLAPPLDKRVSDIGAAKNKRWFWDALLYYMPIYKHVALASVVINCIGVLTPLFVMNVYDRVIPNSATETLWALAIGVALAYFFDFLLRSLRSYFVDVAGRNADVVISSELVRKVLSMRLDVKPESTGALVNNLREFESLREFFSSSTLLACIDLPFLVIFLILLGFIGGPLVFLPLAAMPILFGAGLFLQAAARRCAEQSYKQNMQKNALLVEMISGLETLKCCMAESRMQRLWETVVGTSAEATNEARKYSNIALTLSTLITQFVTVGMVVWGVYLIAAGTLTMGGLIGCNILVGRALAPLMQMASLLTRYQNSRMSLSSLDTLMSLPTEDLEGRTSVDFGVLEPSFTVEHLSFAYPGAERLALDNVSLTIKPGEKIGIVGRMGSGKSTLGRMLIGLYQPRSGAVKFGDVDIRQLPPVDLRGRVGFLTQDVVLFYGSIRDNITLGDPTVNDDLLIRASTLAGVTEFVRANPAGFGAQVGEQGKALSGGQRQAVGLARALVRDPEVLILDEPTSNMDNASEQTVQKRLGTIMQDKTLILITHRLSMLAIVDRLIVMESGRILLDGPRDQVLQQLRQRPAPDTVRASGMSGTAAEQQSTAYGAA